MDLVREMSEEEKVAVAEGLSEEEYGLFCILRKENMGKREREQVKQASKELLEKLESLTNQMYNWWEREQTRSAIEVEIRDHLYLQLPNPPFTSEDMDAATSLVFDHVWQLSEQGMMGPQDCQ
jgi:type I restriction enzyme R subunit